MEAQKARPLCVVSLGKVVRASLCTHSSTLDIISRGDSGYGSSITTGIIVRQLYSKR